MVSSGSANDPQLTWVGVRHGPDGEVGGAEEEDDEERELEPDDPLDSAGVDQGQEGDDERGHEALRQRRVVGGQQAGDRLAEARRAQSVTDSLK